MKPDFREGDKALVSTLKINNLKGPKKMRTSFVGTFTIIKLIGENAVQAILPDKGGKIPLQEEEPHLTLNSGSGGFPGPLHRIIKAREIRLNGKDERKSLVRFNNETADKDKWLAEDGIPDGNLNLRRLRASGRTEQYHQ
ncbi:hypothetical protein O181_011504 [Austropuccinia psidii MF-1]|uniref:Uncharacterized protein n=1 Tax=Austropuccinia psidii MF-1 TaxID=1389203 RepID=A0A9Q3GLX4_9BASI|nr:hypothetical protein [Austropuccinia psidii MF-1]